MKKQIILFTLLLTIPFATVANTTIKGESNISRKGYPDHTTIIYSKPSMPWNMSDTSYQRFQKETTEYLDKLKKYLINAEYDALQIKINSYLAKQEIERAKQEFKQYENKYNNH